MKERQNKIEEIHQGERVLSVIRKLKYPMKEICNHFKISRNSLYVKLKKPLLKPVFIIQLGKLLKHDFSEEFPHLKRKIAIDNVMTSYKENKKDEVLQLQCLKQEEAELNVIYQTMLAFLKKISEMNNVSKIHEKLDDLLANESLVFRKKRKG